MKRFKAKLEPVSHGGLFVVVPEKVAVGAGLIYGARVRGTMNGAPYRSSLMKYSGIFHLGVHKATLEKAGAKVGDRVELTIEIDDQPLPTDKVPDDLAKAIQKKKASATAWKTLDHHSNANTGFGSDQTQNRADPLTRHALNRSSC